MGKKLIEVALPLTEINDASAYDKMPGIGPHPKGIHHWWARLPLPTARAVLFASLVDDPSDDPAFANKSEEQQEEERQRLFGIIEDLLQKKPHLHPEAFSAATQEIRRCCGEEMPTVLDPFCGGGSIPLEAQRLGLESRASDLNPVPVLINKAMLELVCKFSAQAPVNPEARNRTDYHGTWTRAHGLADDVRHYGRIILQQAQDALGHHYPQANLPKEHGNGTTDVLAWIWSRTITCPNPACGKPAPLVKSFMLSSKGTKTWLAFAPNDREGMFSVTSTGPPPPKGTVGKKGCRCLHCGEPFTFAYIRQTSSDIGFGLRLLALVTSPRKGKLYLDATEKHCESAMSVKCDDVMDLPLPDKALGFRVQQYGVDSYAKMYTRRQLLTLTALSNLIRKNCDTIRAHAQHAECVDVDGYVKAVTTFLSFTLDRCADFNNAFTRWNASNEKIMNLFGRGAIPMVWDYGEANILTRSVGGWPTCNEYIAKCIEVIAVRPEQIGEARQLDAAQVIDTCQNLLISTDPPYYDNIGYADLSDFFYMWLRRTVGDLYPDVCSTMLVPKEPELVAAAFRYGGDKVHAKRHFESGFNRAFENFRRVLDARFPLTVFYAFKQEEGEGDTPDLTTGWETMLEAMIGAGYQIVATWPIRASQQWRMRAMGSNALASYIVLACRPRQENAPLSSRREFRALLRSELPKSLEALQHVNIAPVDLAQTTIGPGMAIFSRYAKVVEADGSPMKVRTALSLINEALAEILEEQEGELDEDTRWAVAWFTQFGTGEGPYGTAETLCTAKGTAIDGLTRAGIVHAGGGKVKLIGRDELDTSWDPVTDERLTIWEATQHLIRTLEDEGEGAAASLLAKLGSVAEQARDLAYRLFVTCEKKAWVEEARSYNGLVIAWPELARLAAQEATQKPAQSELELT